MKDHPSGRSVREGTWRAARGLSQHLPATPARVDDIPALIAPRKHMGVAACLDHHGPANGHWQGVSRGKTTVVGLACILADGDHRRARGAPWGNAHQRTLRRCLGSEGTPRARTAERLATPRASLSVAERGGAFARDRHPSVLRVYAVPGRVVRGDTTTAGAYVRPTGLCHLRHRKAQRPDLPQGKIAMAGLDPLGVPLTTPGGAGHTADDPRALPESAKVRQTTPRPGLPSGGDGQRAALSPRARAIQAVPHGASAPSGRALAGLCHAPGEAPATTRRTCRAREQRAG